MWRRSERKSRMVEYSRDVSSEYAVVAKRTIRSKEQEEPMKELSHSWYKDLTEKAVKRRDLQCLKMILINHFRL